VFGGVIKKDLITTTAVVSGIACFLMDILANLPIALALGLGLNAYFDYTVVEFHGSGSIPYQTALTAVFIEGLIFLLLSLIGSRQWLARLIPHSIKAAVGVGIGFFLCFIGMQTSASIGLIGGDSATFVTLGGCPKDYEGTGHVCKGHSMESATTRLGIGGLMVILVLHMFRVKDAILIGILSVSVTS